MSDPVAITDIEFLQLSELKQRHHLYLYRNGSALFRAAIRGKVTKHAELEGRALRDVAMYSQKLEEGPGCTPDATTKDVLLPSLSLTVSEVSLFGDALAVVDLGDRERKKLPLDDIEVALLRIAHGGAEQSLCLLVPDTHKVIESESWRVAVGAIGLIEEPMVTLQNYLSVARSYFPQSRLGDLRRLSDDRRFLARLRKFVEQGVCTPFALSSQIDMIVLGEMEGGEFREVEDVEAKRRERVVLPETLRRFLDNRDSQSLSGLMMVLDRLRHDRMLEPYEILTRLYRATTATLESQDRRYRRLEDPSHCVWAALLLANEFSFLNGDAFVAMDYLCQEYARMAAKPAWFASDEGWQAIAPLLMVSVNKEEKPSRLDSARFDLRRALRARLRVTEREDVDWFRSLIGPIEVPEATGVQNQVRSVNIADVGT